MVLTELVYDPLDGFGDDDTPSRAEQEGREAVRSALQSADQGSSASDAQDSHVPCP